MEALKVIFIFSNAEIGFGGVYLFQPCSDSVDSQTLMVLGKLLQLECFWALGSLVRLVAKEHLFSGKNVAYELPSLILFYKLLRLRLPRTVLVLHLDIRLTDSLRNLLEIVCQGCRNFVNFKSAVVLINIISVELDREGLPIADEVALIAGTDNEIFRTRELV